MSSAQRQQSVGRSALSLLLDRLDRLTSTRDRVLIGITGPPGAGKSTLVRRILDAASQHEGLAGLTTHVPMDGFHLANVELDRLGRRQRKGAPDTFDAWGYMNLLERLKSQTRYLTTNLAVHSAERLAQVQDELNNRPRKTLGWKSPAAALAELQSTCS